MKRSIRGKTVLPAVTKDLPVAAAAIKSFELDLKCGNCSKTVLPAVTQNLPAAEATINLRGVL